MPRIVTEEALDRLAPDDPEARRSRRDLLRLHRAMGTRSIVSRGWQNLVSPERASRPLRILELGAGDGRLLLQVARSLTPPWRHVQLCLMDLQDIVSPSTLAGFSSIGWSARVQVTDVLSWASRWDSAGRLAAPQHWDLISANLLLHHFEDGELDRLLDAVATRADRFFACEPRRAWLAHWGSRLVGVLGANAVTREDARKSVRAGFRGQEIAGHWAQPADGWQVREDEQGIFSHGFSAWRTGADQ